MENAFSSLLEGQISKFFLLLCAHNWGASGVIKYATNGMPK